MLNNPHKTANLLFWLLKVMKIIWQEKMLITFQLLIFYRMWVRIKATKDERKDENEYFCKHNGNDDGCLLRNILAAQYHQSVESTFSQRNKPSFLLLHLDRICLCICQQIYADSRKCTASLVRNSTLVCNCLLYTSPSPRD